MAGVSTPRTGRPMIVKSRAILSVTLLRSGAGSVAARAASRPKPSFRPLASCTTVLPAARHSHTSTLHVAAAAAISS